MIIGHQKQILFLKKMFETSRIPHALLFSGQEKIGKKRVALEFASWILGENVLSHPDFILIEPKKQIISIDQIREELMVKVYLKPSLAKKKVAIIDNAHLMTKEAQNCFLKTLEEPPLDTILILISAFPKLLLPTILSRCQEIKFFPVNNAKIREFLRQKAISNKKIEKIIEVSQGNVGRVMEILENEEILEEAEKIKQTLNQISNMGIFERLEFLKQIKDFKLFLEILVSFLEKKLFDPKEREKAIYLLQFIQNFFSEALALKVDQNIALELLLLRL